MSIASTLNTGIAKMSGEYDKLTSYPALSNPYVHFGLGIAMFFIFIYFLREFSEGMADMVD